MLNVECERNSVFVGRELVGLSSIDCQLPKNKVSAYSGYLEGEGTSKTERQLSRLALLLPVLCKLRDQLFATFL